MDDKIKKLAAFEWLMFLIFGLFWAGAMFLPLHLTSSFENKAELAKNILIMAGPYFGYLAIRLSRGLVLTMIEVYRVSNKSPDSRKKMLADELLGFILLGALWAVIISGPMYLSGAFADQGCFWRNLALLSGPYGLYLIVRAFMIFFSSVGWAVSITVKP